MFIKIFLLLSILSCSGEKSNSPTTIDNKPNQVIVAEEQKLEIPTNGFVVLKNTYDQKKLLTIYNLDKSKWKSFYFDDQFKFNDIDPYTIKPENTLLVFKCIGKENGFYKIVVNENKDIVKYIQESDSNFKFQTTEEHILSVFSVDFNEKQNPLRSTPDDKSQESPKNKNSFYYPIKINGDWLMVEDDNKEHFWIRWRNSEGKLILELYYDA
ncbi:hypothetical protein [Chryseobacterium paludis]|uniref:hypothetical protein n=1 Tax=Chryseobacterium paludis TaxID=2956784 RepID=UPI0021C1036E|nr:hypothetical protein [Chryseobacterium paludis]